MSLFSDQPPPASPPAKPKITPEERRARQTDRLEDVRFEPVSPSDGPALLAMARAFHAEDGHPLTDPGETAVLRVASGEEPLARAWVVRRISAPEPLGYLILTLGYSVEYGGRDGFIDDLYLTPELRGRGIGARLLAFALERAAALGIGTLHLETEVGNADAERLYRAAGFEETGRRLMRRCIHPPTKC
ncbi:GNAT family N-acetyltransferase [Dankookia sp. GCM10030260]|uniref:GNAT family N-acetyltransferase n=1 Tax=Dankookia sp. GCM10030260 TaxID=3273390 RepID=UPI0036128BC5